MAENIFCRAFNADNLSRSDCTADARLNKKWYWLKTFTFKGWNSVEKIAEFNSDRNTYATFWDNLEGYIRKIAELRNARITSTMDIHWISEMFYHCVGREPGRFVLHEEKMDLVNIDNINWIERKENVIIFNDKLHEYRFNISKSTLYKRFHIDPIISFEVKIFKDPLSLLDELFQQRQDLFWTPKIWECIYLPLYSVKNNKKIVYEKSWINIWNASWRERDPNEIYIPIPAIIHQKFPKFFPGRDTPFVLHLPDWNILSAKVCQEWWKALMSNPNKDLWKWLLRTVLKKQEWDLVTYEDLERIWVDCVELYKENWEFYINFKELWTYEKFMEKTI